MGGFDSASISPLGISALATQGGKLYLLQNLDSGQAVSTALDRAITGVSQFAWSRDGLNAAVYSEDSDQVQVLRKLDPRDASKAPALDDPIDLSALTGTVSALAYDGKRLLIGIASPDSGGVFATDGSSAPTLLARAVNPVALSFDSAKGDLYIADKDGNQIWMVRDYAGGATPMLVLDGRAGISAPAGVRVSPDGRRLLVANSGSQAVDAIDLATRASVAHADLDFTPSRVEALGSGPFSLLNSGDTNSPLYLVDGSGDLAVYFVPAGGSQ